MRTALMILAILGPAIVSAADPQELRERRQRAAEVFRDGILLVHARAVADYTSDGFRQDPAFYYLTGLEDTAGAIMAIDGRSHESWLFLPSRPVFNSMPSPTASDAAMVSGIEHVADWSELKSFLDKRAESKTTIYYAAAAYSLAELPANVSAGTGDSEKAPAWVVTIAKIWPEFELKEARQKVNGLMDVQSAAELSDLQAAAKATVGAVLAGIRAIRPGASQRSVEAAVEDACWKAGAHGASFWPWAMVGANSVFPKPYDSFVRYDHLNVMMKAGDLVRLDVGCEWNHYGGDLGRTIPVSGHFTADQREIWNIFVSAYQAGVRSLREGATVDQVFDAWRGELLRLGGTAKSALARQATEVWSSRERVPYWGVHTENLDVGSITGPMRAGTSVDFEPIAAIGGQGYYLEDMFVIRKGGAKLLTPGVPYTADEIEAELGKRP